MTKTITGDPASLFNRLKANDEQALKVFYLHNYPGVERFITDNSGTHEDAKDTYQEAFMAVWRNIQSEGFVFQGEEQLGGYLFAVAKNKWIDQLRKLKKNILVSEDVEVLDPGVVMDPADDILLQSVRSGFNSMGEPCKEVLKRFYFMKQSMQQIATFFSWTDATAKNNKYRCLQRLRTMIKKP